MRRLEDTWIGALTPSADKNDNTRSLYRDGILLTRMSPFSEGSFRLATRGEQQIMCHHEGHQRRRLVFFHGHDSVENTTVAFRGQVTSSMANSLSTVANGPISRSICATQLQLERPGRDQPPNNRHSNGGQKIMMATYIPWVPISTAKTIGLAQRYASAIRMGRKFGVIFLARSTGGGLRLKRRH